MAIKLQSFMVVDMRVSGVCRESTFKMVFKFYIKYNNNKQQKHLKFQADQIAVKKIVEMEKI